MLSSIHTAFQSGLYSVSPATFGEQTKSWKGIMKVPSDYVAHCILVREMEESAHYILKMKYSFKVYKVQNHSLEEKSKKGKEIQKLWFQYMECHRKKISNRKQCEEDLNGYKNYHSPQCERVAKQE